MQKSSGYYLGSEGDGMSGGLENVRQNSLRTEEIFDCKFAHELEISSVFMANFVWNF